MPTYIYVQWCNSVMVFCFAVLCQFRRVMELYHYKIYSWNCTKLNRMWCLFQPRSGRQKVTSPVGDMFIRICHSWHSCHAVITSNNVQRMLYKPNRLLKSAYRGPSFTQRHGPHRLGRCQAPLCWQLKWIPPHLLCSDEHFRDRPGERFVDCFAKQHNWFVVMVWVRILSRQILFCW